jgi:oligoribonuclease
LSSVRSDLLCWIDLEMTGLDPMKNTIVEIATLITDAHLEVVAEGPEIIIHATDEHLGRMIPIVRGMHEKSGLTGEVRRSSVNLADAERETLLFLKEHAKNKSLPLCGNSIWCDRMFLKIQMPDLDAYLHYRCIDVSSFKECATRWNINAISGAPRKGDRHRAMGDIKESIAELKHYRDKWLKPPKVASAGPSADSGKAPE